VWFAHRYLISPTSLDFDLKKLEQWKKQILSNSVMGLVGGVLLVLVSIFRVGILGKELELADYGDVIVALNFFQIIALFLRPGISDLLFRFLSTEKDSICPEFRSALIVLTLYLSIVCAAIIAIIILGFGVPLTNAFYEARPIYLLLVALLPLLLVEQLNETSATLLRIRNKFQFVVFPPLLGAILSLGWIWHAKAGGFLDSYQAAMAIGGGQLVATLIIQISAFMVERKDLILSWDVVTLSPLKGQGKIVKGCLYQTSLIRYLKASSDQGGIFLLGIVGTTSQVAIFGMAYQMTRPLALVLSTVGNAVGPEVHKLIRQDEGPKVARLCQHFAFIGVPLTLLAAVVSWWLGPYLIDWFLRPEYHASVGIFTILLLAYGSMIAFMPLFPAAVALDALKWRNVVVGMRSVYLVIALYFIPTGMTIAVVFLLGSATTRLFNDLPLYRSLKFKN
jgi:O-antigen/teichoic acid export membrane protein